MYFCKNCGFREHEKLLAMDFLSGVHLEFEYLLNINL